MQLRYMQNNTNRKQHAKNNMIGTNCHAPIPWHAPNPLTFSNLEFSSASLKLLDKQRFSYYIYMYTAVCVKDYG